MRKLSREYGWSALGVYLVLSALDFPFCFAAVRLLGIERIGHYEHVVVDGVKGIFSTVWSFGKTKAEDVDASQVTATAVESNEKRGLYDHGVVEAEKRNSGAEASMSRSTLFPLCAPLFHQSVYAVPTRGCRSIWI
jgi:hypothetical protein